MFYLNHETHRRVKDIDSTSGIRGFTLEFDNGNSLSVQWGTYNYCGNKNGSLKDTCETAEIAAWNSEGHAYDFTVDDPEEFPMRGPQEVKGWCTADVVAKYVRIISMSTF